jgi:tRNA uridine 5-carboxymethylaminomethyl modification enzyme
LLLRQDNADLRLTEKGYHAGLIPQARYHRFLEKQAAIEKEIKRVQKVDVAPTEKANNLFAEKNSTQIATGIKLHELIKRPELDYDCLAPLDPDRPVLPPAVQEQVNISIKYEGYIKRQLQQVAQFKKLENKKMPAAIDYKTVPNLRLEAQQKLSAIRPESIGHASRITGVSPADISVLLIYMEQFYRNQ